VDIRFGEANLSFIQRVNEALQLIPDFPETCKSILDVVIEEMDADNCSLMLKDPTSNVLILRAARGREDSRSNYYYPEFSPGRHFEVGEGVAGWVVERGEPLMLDDVSQEPRFVAIEGSRSQVKSLLCVPIRENGEIAGVFNLSRSQKAAFSEYDKLALSYISTQVGAVLSSTRYAAELEGIHKIQGEGGRQTIRTASSSIPQGETPRRPDEITTRNGLAPKHRSLSEAFQETQPFYVDEAFIFFGEKMDRIREVIDQVASTDVTVLIQGESGVGKEIVARALHLNSPRRDKPFIKVNCAALPEELLESELFGYEKGAFTGAYRQKPGKFELAHNGTIFLDEIGDISPSLQAKLLQVLQDGEFSRLGGKADVQVDVRVLVATNRNLEEAVRNGRFREDFYYRLNVVNIFVPPLRERTQEIPVFINHFNNKYSEKYDKRVNPLSPKLMKLFMKHPWSGNIRELENMIKRLVLLGDDAAIKEELSSDTKGRKFLQKSTPKLQESILPILPLKEVGRRAAMQAEREAISKVLTQTDWNRKRAAKLLSISYKAILYKIVGYGLSQ
jgi:transcriptional regulator with GAF, ATPase, and Fis domain